RTPARVDAAPLAERVARADHGPFEHLRRRYTRRHYRLARATLRDDAQAEDELQAASLAAFRTIARFRGHASLSTWLSRLVLN
ncbi:sigma factor, partial [Burkholderia pseudomallei]